MAAVILMILALLFLALGVAGVIYDNSINVILDVVGGILALTISIATIANNYIGKAPETEMQSTETQNMERQEIDMDTLESKLEELYPDAEFTEIDNEYYVINGEEVYLVKVIGGSDTDTDCSLMLKPCDDMIFVE